MKRTALCSNGFMPLLRARVLTFHGGVNPPLHGVNAPVHRANRSVRRVVCA